MVSNGYSVMHSPEVWDDPGAFKPDRILDNKGNFHERAELIPFGLGEFDLQLGSKS